MSKESKEALQNFITKLKAINSSDFEAILKAVESEKESRKKDDADKANKSNEVLEGLVHKIIDASNGDTESILKVIVNAEKEHQKNKRIDAEYKALAEEINSGDYLKYKDAAYKLAALYLGKLIDEVDVDIADALRLVQHNLIEDTKSLDSYVKIRMMQQYLKHYVKHCSSYNEHFMPVHHSIATKAKRVLSRDCFYNDLNYEVKLEAIYNMAKSSAFLE